MLDESDAIERGCEHSARRREVGSSFRKPPGAQSGRREAQLNVDASFRFTHRGSIPNPKQIEAQRQRKVVERAMVEAHPAHARLDAHGYSKRAEKALAPRAAIALTARAESPQSALH